MRTVTRRGAWILTTLAMVGVVAVLITSSAVADAPTPAALAENATGFEGNLSLSPPTDEATKVSSDQANATALKEFPNGDAKVAGTTLATFSWDAVPVDENDKPTGGPLYVDIPVWVVTLDGVCSATDPDTEECLNPATNVVVDATSGEFLIGYMPEAKFQTEPLAG